jgi:hypothetical protein
VGFEIVCGKAHEICVFSKMKTERICRQAGMCRPSGTRLINLSLPGTDVPGYRLFRPCGTALLQPINSAIDGFQSLHETRKGALRG